MTRLLMDLVGLVAGWSVRNSWSRSLEGGCVDINSYFVERQAVNRTGRCIRDATTSSVSG